MSERLTVPHRFDSDFNAEVVARRQRQAEWLTRRIADPQVAEQGRKFVPRNGLCQYAAVRDRCTLMTHGVELLKAFSRRKYKAWAVTYVFQSGIIPIEDISPTRIGEVMQELRRSIASIPLPHAALGVLEPSVLTRADGRKECYLHFHGVVMVDGTWKACNAAIKEGLNQPRNDAELVFRPLLRRKLRSAAAVRDCLRYASKSFHLATVVEQVEHEFGGVAWKGRQKTALRGRDRLKLARIFDVLRHWDRVVLVGASRTGSRFVPNDEVYQARNSVRTDHTETVASLNERPAYTRKFVSKRSMRAKRKLDRRRANISAGKQLLLPLVCKPT